MRSGAGGCDEEKGVNLFGGNWGFGQNRQERKWAFELSIVVDITGQYVLNSREKRRDKGRKEY